MPRTGHVRLLSPEVARKIAAGEVIDRPAAVVRELIDNALDSGATNIELKIEKGGLSLIELSDNGKGMAKEDLLLCTLPHATSKIATEDDLLHLESLGFRGEALASIAAVSHLKILSSQDGQGAHRIAIGPAGSGSLEPHIEGHFRAQGTTVSVEGLFDNLPARKNFIKRPASEALAISKTFIEKALAFPQVNFSLYQDGREKFILPATNSLKERFIAAVIEETAPTKGRGQHVHQIQGQDEGFSLEIVLGSPNISRNDRRHQYIFTNGRRIQEYSFQQALEYGSQGWFPNASHLIGAVFLYIDGHLVDFNIHPAKREARFRDGLRIHRKISSLVRAHYEALARSAGLDLIRPAPHSSGIPQTENRTGKGQHTGKSYADNLFDAPITANQGYRSMSRDRELARAALGQLIANPLTSSPPNAVGAPTVGNVEDFYYHGQAFGLFLLIEKGNELILIDQHAAHERILYNELLENPPKAQELLVPLPFSIEDENEEALLRDKKAELKSLGIDLERLAPGSWVLKGLPSAWKQGDGQTVDSILEMLSNAHELAHQWYRTMACKMAVKDRLILEPMRGKELARATLALEDPHCPHGRPVLIRMSRKYLEGLVKRS